MLEAGDRVMNRDNWVKSMGLDVDGSLFVEIDNGIKLYDLCLNHPLPDPVEIHPRDLMKIENRPLYNRYLTTLNEIAGVMLHPSYDARYRIRSGDIVVDAGARIGTFSAKISAAVGEKGKIIAIEPEPRNFACLLKNIQANNLTNVVAVPRMLWSREEQRDLYLSGYTAAHSAYFDEFYQATGERIRVEADSLDHILESLGIGTVDFIKMDIEGAEIEALAGMKVALEAVGQMAIAAYHPVDGKLTHTVIMPQLEQLGFKIAYSDGIVHAQR